MNILFLDDQVERHDLAEKLMAKNHILLHAYDAEEALDIVSSFPNRIGIALLDHDLGDWRTETGQKLDYKNSGGILTPIRPKDYEGYVIERTGYWFLDKMLVDTPKDKFPARIVVHSYNYTGALNMTRVALEHKIHATQIPFSGEMLIRILESIREN